MIIWPCLISTLAIAEIPPPIVATAAVQHDSASAIARNHPPPTVNPTENYLPRRLYPGTYKNYCGPTPEVSLRDGCRAHGWHGDAPFDEVDAGCQRHDVAYCRCETGLLQRNAAPAPTRGLASLVALRFVTLPVLTRFGVVDPDYLTCINRADADLIATGVRIRQQNQGANCQTNPALGWFCRRDPVGTLAAFEKVNLRIFLKDLDFDEARSAPKGQRLRTLSQLERNRQTEMKKNLKGGMTVGDAVQSKAIQNNEEEMLEYLQGMSIR